MAYDYPQFEYVKPRDFEKLAHHPVVIVGAGLVGLTLALDLAQKGVKTILIDDDNTVSEGSRAIVFAKRSLEILGRLGLGAKLLEKGVGWSIGRVYYKDQQLFEYDYLAEGGHEYPAFLNLQQYYIEEWLINACLESELVEIRWLNRAKNIERHANYAVLDVETPDGVYRMKTDWLLACDGAHSLIRKELGLTYVGKDFPGRFLIADVVMKTDLPAERKFWFDPPFHPGHSVLLHKQPDNVWRVDFQLGLDADLNEAKKPENVLPRLREMFSPELEFSLDWASVYSFRCRRLSRFVHDRIIFVGDSAHQVSPFGGRGGNGGIQDADNLAWKLAAVIQRNAPLSLIESYNEERTLAADENILNSSRSAEFITPETRAAELMRESVLQLSRKYEFARSLVNSGRLSLPSILEGCSLMQVPSGKKLGRVPVGSPAIDAPVEIDNESNWLLPLLGGESFTLLGFDATDDVIDKAIRMTKQSSTPLNVVIASSTPLRKHDGVVIVWDFDGVIADRYHMPSGSFLLIRPDQHVVAGYEQFDRALIENGMAKAQGASGLAPVVSHKKSKSNIATKNSFDDPDALVSQLMRAHENLNDQGSHFLNIQLILLLANQIGDMSIVEDAISIALEYASTEQETSLQRYG